MRIGTSNLLVRTHAHFFVALSLACVFCAPALFVGHEAYALALGAPQGQVEDTVKGHAGFVEKLKKHVGLNYNSFFNGPGPGLPLGYNPNYTGAPSDTGLNSWNYVSVKWKTTDNLGLDLQFRNEVVFTNQPEFRYQGQRLGVSGVFAKGDNWSFWGAINSDIPISPFAGQVNLQRTLVLDPGLFSFWTYHPPKTKFFFFALLAPRVWFYRDENALAIQDVLNGGTKIKYQLDIYLNPSVNYQVTPKTSFRLGTTLEYTKFVGIPYIVRNYMPIEAGVKYDLSDFFSVYTFLLTSTPLDDGLRAAQGFAQNNWLKTLSINLWLSGTLM